MKYEIKRKKNVYLLQYYNYYSKLKPLNFKKQFINIYHKKIKEILIINIFISNFIVNFWKNKNNLNST